MGKFSRPKRPTVCGVPLTNELLLRVILLAVTIGALAAATIPKVKSILQQSKVVSVTMTDDTTIPVPGTLVCGELLDHVQVQMVNRGRLLANGSWTPDTVRDVPTSMYSVKPANTLNLRANGDWPTLGNCVILEPQGIWYSNNPLGEVGDACIDSIVIVALSKANFTAQNDIGLSIAIWDGNVYMGDQQPIWTGIPSINTLTFVYSELIPLGAQAPQTHFTMQKQNLRFMSAGFFANQTVIGRVVLSPDTFFVTRYFDKPSYTWVDLAGAIGGMASIALAIWIFLFGSGKYKSWGVVQRYVLQTSPNSRRFRGSNNDEAKPKNPFEAAKMFVRSQIQRLDTSAEHDVDNVPLQSSTEEHRRVLSARYSKAFDMEVAAAVASGATMTRNGNGGARERGVSPMDGNNNDDVDHRISQYSLDANAPPNFYFSDQGAPLSRSLQPLRPIGSSADDAEEQVDELIRLIDLRMDERMWSLEKTLSRYYLDGFRLRNYSSPRSFRFSDTKEQGQGNYLDYGSGNEQFGQYPPSHAELLQDGADNRAGAGEQQVGQPLSPTSFPTAPQYPPRPQVRDQFDYVIAVHEHAPPPSIGISPVQDDDSKSDFTSPSVSSTSATPFLNPGFPERKDMRGTIRRAVERLQQEWPQTHSSYPIATSAYVPRTQYGTQYQQQQQNQGHPHPSQGQNTGNYY
ncbi:hypothetical protein EMPS_10040 [Entomortierella parvispora]|uniref:Uncharacterized protein n=1 Tax=Entomortierella parvispora TaxID=205924 RepID=A0A9P3M0L7_9FUNG|nr:hypothetical protein EMPS_10040 [Entomortierella parvispora]